MNGDTVPSAETAATVADSEISVLSGLPPFRITLGQSPPSWRGAGPTFLPAHSELGAQQTFQNVYSPA